MRSFALYNPLEEYELETSQLFAQMLLGEQLVMLAWQLSHAAFCNSRWLLFVLVGGLAAVSADGCLVRRPGVGRC